MPDKPDLRLVVDNDEADARLLALLLRTRAVAPDPGGDAIWLLLGPREATGRHGVPFAAAARDAPP
jgi:hypothetical protein